MPNENESLTNGFNERFSLHLIKHMATVPLPLEKCQISFHDIYIGVDKYIRKAICNPNKLTWVPTPMSEIGGDSSKKKWVGSCPTCPVSIPGPGRGDRYRHWRPDIRGDEVLLSQIAVVINPLLEIRRVAESGAIVEVSHHRLAGFVSREGILFLPNVDELVPALVDQTLIVGIDGIEERELPRALVIETKECVLARGFEV